MAEASDVFGRKEKSLVVEHLSCPLCLLGYKQPRVLACLHSFCQHCIQQEIRKNAEHWLETNEVTCPVCQKITPAPSSAKSVEEWAKALPLNPVLAPDSLSRNTYLENESRRACEPCAKEKQMNDAVAFCVECRTYQCKRCVGIHARFAPMKMHTIHDLNKVLKETTPPFDLGKFEDCREHGNGIKYFCEDHSVLCCGECVIGTHRKCSRVTEVKHLATEMKATNAHAQLQSKMEEVLISISKVTDEMERNVTYIGQEPDSLKKKIKEIRGKVMMKMDETVQKISSRCDQLKEEHGSTLSEKISTQKKLKAAIVTSRSLLQSVIDRGTETQIFIFCQKIEEQYKLYERTLHKEQETSMIVDFQMELSQVVEDLIEATEDLVRINIIGNKIDALEPKKQRLKGERPSSSASSAPSFGEVDGKRRTVRNSLAVLDVTNPLPIVHCKMEKVAMVEIEKKKDMKIPVITGVAYLPNGRLVTVDFKNKLCCLLDNKYKVVADVKLKASPLGISLVSDKELVVVLDGKGLQCISVDTNLTLTRTIACSREPYRIARINESELAVGWWKAGVGIISLKDGKEKMYLDKDITGKKIKIERNDFIALDVNKERFYQTCRKDNAMYCFGIDGKPYFIYTNERPKLDEPSGIVFDRDSNVYTCSWGTHNVHQVSPDGKLIRTIDVGLPYPYTICFNTTGDQMVVIDNLIGVVPKLVVVRFVP